MKNNVWCTIFETIIVIQSLGRSDYGFDVLLENASNLCGYQSKRDLAYFPSSRVFQNMFFFYMSLFGKSGGKIFSVAHFQLQALRLSIQVYTTYQY